MANALSNKPQRNMLAQAALDPSYWSSVRQGLADAMNRGVIGGIVGAPVDIANTALGAFGLGSQMPVMGSEWIGQQMQNAGLVSGNRNALAEGLASFIDPATIGASAAKFAGAIPAIVGMAKNSSVKDALTNEITNIASKNGYLISHDKASTGTEYLIFDNGKDRFQVRFGDHAPGYRFNTGNDIGATGVDSIWDANTLNGKIMERIIGGPKTAEEVKKYGASDVTITDEMKRNAATAKAERNLDSEYRSMRDAQRAKLGISRAEWDRSDRFVPGYKELLNAEIERLLQSGITK